MNEICVWNYNFCKYILSFISIFIYVTEHENTVEMTNNFTELYDNAKWRPYTKKTVLYVHLNIKIREIR